MSRRRRQASIGTALAVVALTLATGAPATHAGACGQPHSPVYDQQIGDADPAIDVTDVTVQLAGDRDFDGDGTVDSDVAGSTVRRPAGDITFERPSALVFVTNAGELDGNPGHEIWVIEVDSSFRAIGSWLVPYTTSAGVHDPATVGVEVTPGAPARLPDGSGAVWVTEGFDPNALGGTTHRFVGADLFAVGIPGDATAVAPTHSVEGRAVALVDFGGSEPALLTAVATSLPSGDQSLDLALVEPGGALTRLTSAPVDLVGFAAVDIGFAGLTGTDGRFIVAAIASRSGSQAVFWSLDDPCTALSADTTTAPASTPPATPVVAQPTFTG